MAASFATGSDAAGELVLAGIVILAATPVLRVVSLLVIWSRARDWRFAIVALAVVAIVSSAAILGRG
ncbi:MAG TPA: DUF1634 domain-containing protein [Polyangiaceae bacterium]|nr:DUF1634 domain-containing protein [Polyangiaceae bacterium]